MTQDMYTFLVDALGEPSRTTSDGDAIYAFWTPIHDRTEEDCVYGSLRGSFDWRTRNRIEANVEYITYAICVRGSIFSTDTILGATREDYLFIQGFNRIVQNCLDLAGRYNITRVPELLEAFSPISIEEANLIEEVTFGALDAIDRQDRSMFYSGEVFAGEV